MLNYEEYSIIRGKNIDITKKDHNKYNDVMFSNSKYS